MKISTEEAARLSRYQPDEERVHAIELFNALRRNLTEGPEAAAALYHAGVIAGIEQERKLRHYASSSPHIAPDGFLRGLEQSAGELIPRTCTGLFEEIQGLMNTAYYAGFKAGRNTSAD
jgi:hypothetical protein